MSQETKASRKKNRYILKYIRPIKLNHEDKGNVDIDKNE